MRIVEKYSHLNGEEFLIVHHPDLWDEVIEVIESVDIRPFKTKVSKEKRNKGKLLYAPKVMNKAIAIEFKCRGWKQRRQTFWVTSDEQVLRGTARLPSREQKQAIEDAGYEPIRSYNQTDFVKEQIAVEVQFGKYAFVAHDLFVKHMAFFVSGVIDVGIEILPMKEMEMEMSSGVAYYERDLLNIMRQGRGIPAVPLVLIGVAP